MRALTLHRPHSHCVAHLGKSIENRSWPLPSFMLGQRCAIHAGKVLDKAAVFELERAGMKLPAAGGSASAIVATVRFIACLEGDGSDYGTVMIARGVGPARVHELAKRWRWFSGPFGWVMDELRTLPEPVACKGAQGFWNLPAAVEHEVVRREARAMLAKIDDVIATVEGRR